MSVPGEGHVQALHPVLIDPVEGLTLCHCEMVPPVPADACGRNISISEHTPVHSPPFCSKAQEQLLGPVTTLRGCPK